MKYVLILLLLIGLAGASTIEHHNEIDMGGNNITNVGQIAGPNNYDVLVNQNVAGGWSAERIAGTVISSGTNLSSVLGDVDAEYTGATSGINIKVNSYYTGGYISLNWPITFTCPYSSLEFTSPIWSPNGTINITGEYSRFSAPLINQGSQAANKTCITLNGDSITVNVPFIYSVGTAIYQKNADACHVEVEKIINCNRGLQVANGIDDYYNLGYVACSGPKGETGILIGPGNSGGIRVDNGEFRGFFYGLHYTGGVSTISEGNFIRASFYDCATRGIKVDTNTDSTDMMYMGSVDNTTTTSLEVEDLKGYSTYIMYYTNRNAANHYSMGPDTIFISPFNGGFGGNVWVANAAGTTVTGNTPTIIPYDTVINDSWGQYFAGGGQKFVRAEKAGKYHVTVNFKTAAFSQTLGNEWQVLLYRNGVLDSCIGTFYEVGGTHTMGGVASGTIGCNYADLLTIYLYKVSSGDTTLLADAAYNFWCVDPQEV